MSLVKGKCGAEDTCITVSTSATDITPSGNYAVQQWTGADSADTQVMSVGFPDTDANGFPARNVTPTATSVQTGYYTIAGSAAGIQAIGDGFLVIPAGTFNNSLTLRVSYNLIDYGEFYLSEDNNVANMTSRGLIFNSLSTVVTPSNHDPRDITIWRWRTYLTDDFINVDFNLEYQVDGAGVFTAVPASWFHNPNDGLISVVPVTRQAVLVIECGSVQLQETDGTPLVLGVDEKVLSTAC
jgi:hypothetical protein